MQTTHQAARVAKGVLMVLALVGVAWGAEAPSIQKAARADTLLFVRTTPSGAAVWLDKKPLGKTNATFLVEPGRYKLVIDLAGHQSSEQQISIRGGVITRIEMTLIQQPGDAAPVASAGKAPAAYVAQLCAKVDQRMDADKKQFGLATYDKIEAIYQVANRDKHKSAPETRMAMKQILTQWPHSNRAGCACVYLGMGSRGEEAISYFKQAIQEYDDCWWGNGTQVGALARYQLILELDKSKAQAEIAALERELQTKYPGAVDDDGFYLTHKLAHRAQTPAPTARP